LALAEARELGLLGPGPISTHLAHAQGFVEPMRRHSPTPDAARLVDLGSGGGLPGLVVAACWPEVELVLLDASARRTDFLRRAVDQCEFGQRVTVVQQRAELFGRDPDARHSFDGVLVRSFGPPAVVAECAAPLLKKQGCVIVSEPPESTEWAAVPEGRWPASGLAECGLEAAEYLRGEFGYQVLRQVELCPEKFPRRDGVPAKKPLF